MFRPVLTVRTNHNKTAPAHVLCFAHNTQAGVLLFFRYDPPADASRFPAATQAASRKRLRQYGRPVPWGSRRFRWTAAEKPRSRSGILRIVPAQNGTHQPVVPLRQSRRPATPDRPHGRHTLRAARMPGYISLFHASRCSTISRLSRPTWQSRNSTLTPAAFASDSAVPNSG